MLRRFGFKIETEYDMEENRARIKAHEVLDNMLIPDLANIVDEYMFVRDEGNIHYRSTYERELHRLGFSRGVEESCCGNIDGFIYWYYRVFDVELLREPITICVQEWSLITINGQAFGSIRNHGIITMRKTFKKCLDRYILRKLEDIKSLF